jgi:Uncharacterized conserved protein (DUF2304)
MYPVSPERIQAVEVAIVACLFAFAVIVLSKKGRISFRYTIGWLTLSALTAFGGLLLPVIEPLLNKVRLDAFSLVGALSVIVLLSLCIQLSISISGIQIQLRLLNEELAIQKNQLDVLNDLQK